METFLERSEPHFTLVYVDYNNKLKSYVYDSLDDLIEDCEAEELEPKNCLIFKGRVEPMGLKSSYALVPFVDTDEDEDEDEDED
jgi:hypothetical protein